MKVGVAVFCVACGVVWCDVGKAVAVTIRDPWVWNMARGCIDMPRHRPHIGGTATGCMVHPATKESRYGNSN